MKKIVSLTTLALGTLLATGCATDAAYSSAPARPGEIVVDGRYVAVVENIAKQRGTRVVWVNKPTKRVSGPVAVVD